MESIDEGDFVIRVRPTEVDGEWTGEVDISIISQANNPLNDEGYTQLMHFCKMMCATIPIMEQDESLRNLVHTYVMEVVDREDMKMKAQEESMASLQSRANVAWANQQTDMVNSPPHYNKAGIECIDAIAAATGDGYEHYLQGNILKYLWRYRYKNGTEDLKKAQWYLTKLIKEVEGMYDES